MAMVILLSLVAGIWFGAQLALSEPRTLWRAISVILPVAAGFLLLRDALVTEGVATPQTDLSLSGAAGLLLVLFGLTTGVSMFLVSTILIMSRMKKGRGRK